MKKVLFGLILVLFLVGCGRQLVHDDFKADLEQVLTKFDTAYDENRRINEDEEELYEKFYDKYIIGELYIDDELYEMSDIEKEIVREIGGLKLFTEHSESLASEKTMYETKRDTIEDLLEAKEIPERIAGKHPVYKKQEEINPTFESETKEIINYLDDILVTQSVDVLTMEELEGYVMKYAGPGFEIDGIHYLHNEETKDIYLSIMMLEYEIKEESINNYTEKDYLESRDRFLNR